MGRARAAMLFALGLCAACDGGADGPPCTPGSAETCACPDGSSGTRLCAERGPESACRCGGAELACEPGSERACDCAGGAVGIQACLADGTFTSCSCGVARRPAPGAPASAALDAGAPGRLLTQRCCHGLGRCLDGALVPAEATEVLTQGECAADDDVCVPDAYAAPAGFELQPCRSTAGVEGRCVVDCGEDPVLSALPRDLCDPQARCAPCFDPLTGADSGVCRLSLDRGPREPARVFERCCGDDGACLPRDVIPPGDQALLGADSCQEAGALCVPRRLLVPEPSLDFCRGTAALEGRCLPRCLPVVAAGEALLAQAECEEGDACVPCFDPLDGSATGACALVPDDAPTDPPVVFARCCDLGEGPEGHCVPADALPVAIAEQLPQESCPSPSDRCVLQSQIEAPEAALPTCSTLLSGAGRCLKRCLIDGNLSGILRQRDCADADDLCVPCNILGAPTGVCATP